MLCSTYSSWACQLHDRNGQNKKKPLATGAIRLLSGTLISPHAPSPRWPSPGCLEQRGLFLFGDYSTSALAHATECRDRDDHRDVGDLPCLCSLIDRNFFVTDTFFPLSFFLHPLSRIPVPLIAFALYTDVFMRRNTQVPDPGAASVS